jgi:hypothetical protein
VDPIARLLEVLRLNGLVQYDHFNPEFKDARMYDAAGIALLCGTCHDGKTRKRISAARAAAARLDPFALQAGFVRQALEIKTTKPIVCVGSVSFVVERVLLSLRGDEVLSVDPPEDTGAPWRLNALFEDRRGTPVCSIVDNEIRTRASSWTLR